MVRMFRFLGFVLVGAWWCLEAFAATYNNADAALKAAGIEFAAIRIEGSSTNLPVGFMRQEDIVGAPGVRIPHFAKSYGDNEYDYAFISAGIFNGKIVFKLFEIVQK